VEDMTVAVMGCWRGENGPGGEQARPNIGISLPGTRASGTVWRPVYWDRRQGAVTLERVRRKSPKSSRKSSNMYVGAQLWRRLG